MGAFGGRPQIGDDLAMPGDGDVLTLLRLLHETRKSVFRFGDRIAAHIDAHRFWLSVARTANASGLSNPKAPDSPALPHLLAEPYLDQRLIRHVALMRGDLDLLQQADRKAQRNRRRARLQIGQSHRLCAAPVEIRSRILALPIGAFVGFARKLPRRITCLGHRWSLPKTLCGLRESMMYSPASRPRPAAACDRRGRGARFGVNRYGG